MIKTDPAKPTAVNIERRIIIEYGWRTVIVEHPADLALQNGNLFIRGDAEKTIPVSQLRSIIVNNSSGSFSVELLNALCQNNVSVTFCDKQYNPSCDMMEPFRPFADQIVWENKENDFDWQYKKQLIALPLMSVRYGGKTFSLSGAAEAYITDVLKAMENTGHIIKELSFV